MGLSSLTKDSACAPSIGSTETPEKSHYFLKFLKIHILLSIDISKSNLYHINISKSLNLLLNLHFMEINL